MAIFFLHEKNSLWAHPAIFNFKSLWQSEFFKKRFLNAKKKQQIHIKKLAQISADSRKRQSSIDASKTSNLARLNLCAYILLFCNLTCSCFAWRGLSCEENPGEVFNFS